jgi:hypothetical protein
MACKTGRVDKTYLHWTWMDEFVGDNGNCRRWHSVLHLHRGFINEAGHIRKQLLRKNPRAHWQIRHLHTRPITNFDSYHCLFYFIQQNCNPNCITAVITNHITCYGLNIITTVLLQRRRGVPPRQFMLVYANKALRRISNQASANYTIKTTTQS